MNREKAMRHVGRSCAVLAGLLLAAGSLVELSDPAAAQGVNRRSGPSLVVRPVAPRRVEVRRVERPRASVVPVRRQGGTHVRLTNRRVASRPPPNVRGKQMTRPAAAIRRNPGTGQGGSSIGEARPDRGGGGVPFAGSPSPAPSSPPPVVIATPADTTPARRQAPAAVVAPAQAAPTRSATPRLPVGAAAPSVAPSTGVTAARPLATAQGGWDHNGSVMRLAAEGGVVRFHYEQPRRGLSDVGIRPGALLFTARNTSANAYAGEVVTFSRKCGDMTFPVTGEASSDGARLVVSGNKPMRDGRCRVTGTRPETLVFELRPASR